MERHVASASEMENKKEKYQGSYLKITPESLPLEEFQNSPIYKSTEIVKGVWLEHGQEIRINPDGNERKIIANWGDRLVKYQNGHSDYIRGDEVNLKLRPTGKENEYETDIWVKVNKEYDEGIFFISPLTGLKLGQPGSRFAVRYLPEADSIGTIPFLLTKEDFATYEVVPAEQLVQIEPIAA